MDQSERVAMRRATPAVAFEILHDSPERVLILDTRTVEEFTGPLGHLRDALSIPLEELPFRLEQIAAHRERTFLVYCRNDDCGPRAMQILLRGGFEGATLVAGGIEAWVGGGFGTVDVTAPAPPPIDRRFGVTPAAGSEPGATAGAEKEQAKASQAGERSAPKPGEAYLRLADGSLILPPRRPNGFYVRGRLAGGRFFPSGAVFGEGEFCPGSDRRRSGAAEPSADVVPAWIELTDGMLYADSTARTPARPLVRGCLRPDGHFSPATRDIDY